VIDGRNPKVAASSGQESITGVDSSNARARKPGAHRQIGSHASAVAAPSKISRSNTYRLDGVAEALHK
jgi:hypothetical protein